MQHLLLARFQGALIGGNIIYLSSGQISHNQLMSDAAPALTAGINCLIDRGQFDIRDWARNIIADVSNPDQAVIAMLPLMLFFHEDRIKLREVVISVSRAWELDWETCSSAVAIGYIISRSLTESFDPRMVVSQLLDQTINLHPHLFQELSLIDRLTDQSSSLHQVAQRLEISTQPIITSTIWAIYCLITTPEDFSLATRRAERIDDRSLLTCALTGIFTGVQNGLNGIPLNGLLATRDRSFWLSSAVNLLATWAGIDHLVGRNHPFDVRASPAFSLSSTPASPLVVAAPRVIQRRD
jgi:ADP-ribosylglycohydrolase